MPQVEGQCLTRRLSISGIHHADDALVGDTFERPAVFNQHIRIRRSATIGPFRHERHVRHEHARRIDLLEYCFDNRRLTGDALRIAVHGEAAVRFVHRGVARDRRASVFKDPAQEIPSDARRCVSLPGEEDRYSHRSRQVGTALPPAA
jgi:hypothetical protein